MRVWSFLLLFFSVSCLFSSCKPDDEELNTSPGVRLGFDQDTVQFDTVFTATGSVSKRLWVYNRDRHAVNIERIELARASGTQYSLVINGQETDMATNVKLRGEDSLLVLVKVKVIPNDNTQPFVLADSIRFITNGNLQDVDLVAAGQNAYFHFGGYLDNCNEVWPADKPHVVLGSVGVLPACSLTITPGVRVYFHAGAALVIEGTLLVNGTAENRVSFQGDRLEERYDNRPGQWFGILLDSVTTTSQITYADVKNAVYGVYVASPQPGPLDLDISQTTIRNMIANGLVAFTSDVRAVNCLFTNTGQAALGTFIGGNYEFIHCTIANFGGFFLHDQPSARFEARTKLVDGSFLESPLSLNLYNSIIYGSLRDEVALIGGSGTPTFDFRNNIIRTDEYESLFESAGDNVVSQAINYPKFDSPSQGNLLPDSANSTVAIGLPGLTGVDVRGLARPNPAGSTPDAGAYEVQQP